MLREGPGGLNGKNAICGCRQWALEEPRDYYVEDGSAGPAASPLIYRLMCLVMVEKKVVGLVLLAACAWRWAAGCGAGEGREGLTIASPSVSRCCCQTQHEDYC